MRWAFRWSHRLLALSNCSRRHSIAVIIPCDKGFGFVNLSTFFGILGCWLGWRVEMETSESFFKGVGDGVVGVVNKVSESSSSRGSCAACCEHSVCVLKHFGEVRNLIIAGGRGHVLIDEGK